MKSCKIILLLLISNSIVAQLYNSIDSTYKFTYKEALKIKDTIETYKYNSVYLTKEVILLNELSEQSNLLVSKLKSRDSLYSIEIEKSKEMDILMREKIIKSNDILNNYKTELRIANDLLQEQIKYTKKEKLWKNIYKYVFPIGFITSYILIKY